MLINDFDNRFMLDVKQMDETHLEFVDLVNRLDVADKESFQSLFKILAEHTKAHFENEQLMMEQSGFPATSEHVSDHQRVLGELARFGKRVAAGSTTMARAYVREQLPHWFDLHVKTMDSALAAHLKSRQV
ncbi:MAG: hemerythrin family protein [Candidatus Thiodiazotropha sp.]